MGNQASLSHRVSGFRSAGLVLPGRRIGSGRASHSRKKSLYSIGEFETREVNKKQRAEKRPRGKPFRKRDPRINREDKSKELAELEKEFRQAIAAERYRLNESDKEDRP
jgi:hypothetical protein